MPKIKAGRILLIGSLVAVVAIVLVVLLLTSAKTSGSASCDPNPPPIPNVQMLVLAACHATAELPAHSYTTYAIPEVSDGITVAGQYTVSSAANGSFHVYLLNSSELGGLPHSPTNPPPKSYWNSTADPVGNFSIRVPGSPTQFFLVLENIGAGSISVTWTQALVIYYPPPST